MLGHLEETARLEFWSLHLLAGSLSQLHLKLQFLGLQKANIGSADLRALHGKGKINGSKHCVETTPQYILTQW